MLFAASDAFNSRPSTIDPQSDAWIAALSPHFASANLSNDPDWGIPVYQASMTDERYRVMGSQWLIQPFQARIPDSAVPNSGSDHQMVVLSPGGRYSTEAWEAGRDSQGRLTGAIIWQFDTTLTSSGQKTGGVAGGVTASRISLLAGLVRPSELQAGIIPHALAMCVPNCGPTFRAPADWPAGTTPDGIPAGARLQLDPSLPIPAGTPGWIAAVWTALQTYGAIITDQAGSLQIRAESSVTGSYPAAGAGGLLTGIPWGSLRVLA